MASLRNYGNDCQPFFLIGLYVFQFSEVAKVVFPSTERYILTFAVDKLKIDRPKDKENDVTMEKITTCEKSLGCEFTTVCCWGRR